MLVAVAKVSSDKRGSQAGRDGGSSDDRRAPNIVIAAFLRAKLLGIKILTLDARIVLTPADSGSDVAAAAGRARVVRASPSVRGISRGGDLAHAVRLLEEGSKSLDEVRGRRSFDARSTE